MTKQDLAQMGAAKVSLECLDGVQCIRKQQASQVEVNFYQTASHSLSGVNAPKLLGISDNDLLIEYIPHSISLDELVAHDQTFKQLASIHNSTYIPTFDVKEHVWTVSATEQAFESLQLPNIVESSILAIQAKSGVVFERLGLISGDTNDGNWGVRSNGDLVLFDWERFGFGSPAIDLAPLVKGLGTPQSYQALVERYRQHSAAISQPELVRQLIIAKCWIIVEVVNILTSKSCPTPKNSAQASKYIQWYQNHIPQWLALVEKEL